jgi:hypothetical protein
VQTKNSGNDSVWNNREVVLQSVVILCVYACSLLSGCSEIRRQPWKNTVEVCTNQ